MKKIFILLVSIFMIVMVGCSMNVLDDDHEDYGYDCNSYINIYNKTNLTVKFYVEDELIKIVEPQKTAKRVNFKKTLCKIVFEDITGQTAVFPQLMPVDQYHSCMRIYYDEAGTLMVYCYNDISI